MVTCEAWAFGASCYCSWLSAIGCRKPSAVRRMAAGCQRSARGRDLESASAKIKRTYGSIALCYGAGRRDAVFASAG